MTDPSEEGVSPSLLGGLFQRILEDCKVGTHPFSFSSLNSVVETDCKDECIPLTICSRERRMRSRDPISHYFPFISLLSGSAPAQKYIKIKISKYEETKYLLILLLILCGCTCSKYLMKDKVSSRVSMR